MFPTTMAVHAAVPRLFAFAGLPLSVFEFTVPTKDRQPLRPNQCDHAGTMPTMWYRGR